MATDASDLNVFAEQFGRGFVSVLRRWVTVIIIITVFILLVYFIIQIVLRVKRNRKITKEQNEILIKGKLICKRFRLHHLYTSEEDKKLVDMGKISSYVRVKEKEDIYSIFAVKKGFMDYKFIKIKPDRHSNLFGDVTLFDWNFILDLQSKFYVMNVNELTIKRIKKINESVGVDSIGNLAPVIQKSVQVNPRHRIRLRESKLIKIPDENISSIAQGISDYLGGK